MKLIIVSNRLPFTFETSSEGLQSRPSIGGLATGINSYVADEKSQLYNETPVHWYGNAGQINQADAARLCNDTIGGVRYHPVFVPADLYTGYYKNFCNENIYPLFIGFTQLCKFSEHSWNCYHEVNRIYSETLLRELDKGDVIFINDYHFLLLPYFIRRNNPGAAIGMFLHTPFPPKKVFGMLPSAIIRDLLRGMLGADLVGFHTAPYRSNFIKVVKSYLGAVINGKDILYRNAVTRLGIFPMGIDYGKQMRAASLDQLKMTAGKFVLPGKKLKTILSVDRLDYTKGITHKLWSYETLLSRYPNWHHCVKLVVVVAPSRVDIQKNIEIAKEIQQLVTQINTRYGTVNWRPIEYHYRQFDFAELVHLYRTSDVAMVTPIKDGMNLVAKEYLSSRTSADGVLILSRHAGAKHQLCDALFVEPSFISDVAKVINKSLKMPIRDQQLRTKRMQEVIREYDVFHWMKDILAGIINHKRFF